MYNYAKCIFIPPDSYLFFIFLQFLFFLSCKAESFSFFSMQSKLFFHLVHRNLFKFLEGKGVV